jgi:phosphate-selective porin OprO and OprP
MIRRIALLLALLFTTAASLVYAQEPGPALELPTSPSADEASTTAAPGRASTLETANAPPAGWKDSFFIQSPDKAYVLRITGQIQADYRNFLQHDATDIDTFLVRRARFGLEATMFNYYEFRFLPDFGQGQAKVQDAYMNIHYVDYFQVEAGKFKQPFSYEQLIQDRFVPTMERSLIDQLVPARDVGFMIHGQKLCGDRLDYAVSISNGEINGDTDTNDRKDLTGRIAVRPFVGVESGGFLRGLQLGICGSTGFEQAAASPATLRTPATVPWFKFSSTGRADGVRNRWSPELAYFQGSFGCAAQYFRQDQEFRASAAGPGASAVTDVPYEGFYVLATYLLTGEQRTGYSQAIDPLNPFDPQAPCLCTGAWELVARASRLHVGDNVFLPAPLRLADPGATNTGATEMTLGLNWYLNRWFRAQLNWEHAWFDEPVRLSPDLDGFRKDQDTLLVRLQIIF